MRLLGWLRSRRLELLLGLVVLVAVVAGAGLLFPTLIGREPTKQITAYFPEAPGLYQDNSVDILGVQTGHVVSVTPGEHSVRVVFEVPRSTRLPRDVRAVLLAPNPVSDRSIELYPAYTGGPQLAAGASIPLARTVVPLEVDKVFAAVADLSRTLGTAGANSDGSLSSVLSALARLTNGNGRSLQNTLAALASALPAFTAKPGQLSALIDSLDTLGSTLARHDSTIDAFLTNVTRATGDLADERGTLAAAIANLQDALSKVTAFVRDNRASIKGSLAGLATTAGAIAKDQRGLMTTLSTAALGFQNVNRAIDTTAPCLPGESAAADGTCPIVFGRLDFTPQSESIVRTYCRDALNESIPIVASSVPGISALGVKGVSDPSVANGACVASYAVVQGHGGTPGAPNSPDLGLRRFLP